MIQGFNCQEIDGLAWGYIEYKKELTQDQADAYELVLEGKRQYWYTSTVYNAQGRIRAKAIRLSEDFRRPLNMSKRMKGKNHQGVV